MKSAIIQQVIEKHLVPKEGYIYGFADLTGLLPAFYKDFPYGISIGRKLDNKIINGIMSGPTLEYYQHYRQMNEELAGLTQALSEDLKKAGVDNICLEPTVSAHELDSVYVGDLTVPVSHKMVATRAGLGWIGKSDLFVSKAFGPRLRLVSILAGIPLDCDVEPVVQSRCGACRICMDRCPAGAINGKPWDTSVRREEFFDAFACREKCKELGEKHLQMNVRVCGICVAVCPFGW
ncbi:MAG: hypothetical protein MUC31_06480 [Bacteroidales bacterium]|jgi:epoxyqueuosine reductase QueG|nr:hypothetical protein [Bacteroidales bacterium]